MSYFEEARLERYSVLKLYISLGGPSIFLLPLVFSSTRLCPAHLCIHLWQVTVASEMIEKGMRR